MGVLETINRHEANANLFMEEAQSCRKDLNAAMATIKLDRKHIANLEDVCNKHSVDKIQLRIDLDNAIALLKVGRQYELLNLLNNMKERADGKT